MKIVLMAIGNESWNNVMKRFLILLCLALPAVVQAQFTFTTNADNTITITGYSEFVVDVSIPDSIDGLPVTGIADLYFPAAGYVASISIPASVTNLTPNAFSSVGALITVDLNNPALQQSGRGFIPQGPNCARPLPVEKPTGSYAIPDTVATSTLGTLRSTPAGI